MITYNMKVVLVSNFDLYTVNDKLLKDNLSQEEANKIAEDYNNSHSENSDYYAQVKDDDYKLYRFNP